MTRHLAAGTVAVCTGKPPTAGAELTATRDLLTAENERLQQEHNAYCRKLANDGLTVAGRLQRELDAVRAENDTLHYLLRGGQ